MNAYIVSDIHIGSRFGLMDAFIAFVNGLPPEATLILNGDVVDRWHGALAGRHLDALNAIRAAAARRPVVWVRGNHDEQFDAGPTPGLVIEEKGHAIAKRLYVAHGNDFDNIMPRNRVFVRTIRYFHHLRLRLGAEAVHVAFYAKRWRLLYRVLRNHVRGNAVEYARENGFAAVTCGHTHFVEDMTVDGIRYINTGAWTEKPVFALHVTDAAMTLEEVVS